MMNQSVLPNAPRTRGSRHWGWIAGLAVLGGFGVTPAHAQRADPPAVIRTTKSATVSQGLASVPPKAVPPPVTATPLKAANRDPEALLSARPKKVTAAATVGPVPPTPPAGHRAAKPKPQPRP